jgi:hypothetical protein
MSVADTIVSALVEQSRRDMADKARADAERSIGEVRLDIDFYSKADAKKPAEDYDFHAHGHHYKGFGARWAVWKVRWTGSEWRRMRKLTGPLKFADVLTEVTEQCKRLDLKRVGR